MPMKVTRVRRNENDFEHSRFGVGFGLGFRASRIGNIAAHRSLWYPY
jgi:hypothetical protein